MAGNKLILCHGSSKVNIAFNSISIKISDYLWINLNVYKFDHNTFKIYKLFQRSKIILIFIIIFNFF